MCKWIGFDMDECLGSLMPLYPFLIGLKHLEQPRDALYYMQQVLIDSELTGNTWILRPAMIDTLKYVYQAYKRGLIYGAFIYSNNSSSEIVRFAQYLCDGIIWRLFDLKDTPKIFKMGLHYCDGIRAHKNLVKSFGEIQDCLLKLDLPLMESVDDLLFFDDLKHVLADEIPNYIQVPAYKHTTPAYKLIELFDLLENVVGAHKWNAIIAKAIKNQTKYVSTHKPLINDKYIFKIAIMNFIGFAPTKTPIPTEKLNYLNTLLV